ncbi:MAG: polyphosphate kinase 2 [Myxococcota bacterium]|jgi:polyphosphate kinase 2
MVTSNRLANRITKALDGAFPGDDGSLNAVISGLGKGPRQQILRGALQAYFEGEELAPYQAELTKLQAHLESTGHKAIVLFDGRDASGKGGTIRRLTRYMNPKHYRVVALGKPTAEQQGELHMKRYIEQFPRAGELVLFDRSWYNRAMVEPVMGFCTPKQYRQFMDRVNSYEEAFVADGKTTLLKLYFSVSKAEQAKRFKRRENDPLRSWKLSEVDRQAQELWDEFTEVKYQLLAQTHTTMNPWYIIRSDDKHLARLETMKLILRSSNFKDRAEDLDLSPNPDVLIVGDKELKRMQRQMKRKGKAAR